MTNNSSTLSLTGEYGFSYIYDNALAGSSRILTDVSAGPDYINLYVIKIALQVLYQFVQLELEQQR